MHAIAPAGRRPVPPPPSLLGALPSIPSPCCLSSDRNFDVGMPQVSASPAVTTMGRLRCVLARAHQRRTWWRRLQTRVSAAVGRSLHRLLQVHRTRLQRQGSKTAVGALSRSSPRPCSDLRWLRVAAKAGQVAPQPGRRAGGREAGVRRRPLPAPGLPAVSLGGARPSPAKAGPPPRLRCRRGGQLCYDRTQRHPRCLLLR